MSFKLFNNKFGKTPALVAGVLFFMFFSTFARGQAQGGATLDNDVVSHKFALYDENGKPFLNPYTEITGNPFFMEAWKYGAIIITDNTVFTNTAFRLNLKDAQVHFRSPENTELVIKVGAVKQLTLLDTVKGTPQMYIFQSGFPSVDNQNQNSFYQVLSDGKLKFLKSLRKVIHEEKDPFSGEVKREFRLYEDYYFYVQGSMERIKRNKEDILEFMTSKRKKIEEYLQTNKVSFKSTEDIRKLVDYYNSL